MNRKAFRCGVLALLLTASIALPVTSTVPGSRSSRPARPAVSQGIFERTAELVVSLFNHLTGANRGGIDPNGLPTQDPSLTGGTAGTVTSGDPGDNRGGIDPNG